MVSTYTDNLRITKQGDNDNPNTWGQIVNNQVISLLEEAITGVTTIDITGSSNINIASTVVNGATDSARNAVLQLTGVLGANIELTVPAVEKLYVIRSAYTGAFTVTVKPAGGSTGIAFDSAQTSFIYTNGTNIYEVSSLLDPALFLQVSNNLSDLLNDATARTNLDVYSKAEVDTEISDLATIVNNALTVIYPVGTTSAWGGVTAPTKHLLCQGQAISRTTYSALFAILGTAYGVGDGSTTFNIPDLRGEFIRGFDAGRGIDAARVLGSFQDQMFKQHGHTNRHSSSPTYQRFGQEGNGWLSNWASGFDDATTAVEYIDDSLDSTAGTETRPRNVAMNYIIYTGV